MRFVPLPPTRQRHDRTSHYDPLKHHSGCKCWPGRLCIARSTMTASLVSERFKRPLRQTSPTQHTRHVIHQPPASHPSNDLRTRQPVSDNMQQCGLFTSAATVLSIGRNQTTHLERTATTSKESVGIHCCCNGRRHGTRAFDETKQNFTRIH